MRFDFRKVRVTVQGIKPGKHYFLRTDGEEWVVLYLGFEEEGWLHRFQSVADRQVIAMDGIQVEKRIYTYAPWTPR